MRRSGPQNYPVDEARLAAFGERLRLARLRRKFTLELVAKRAGVSRTTMYKVERGAPEVTIGTYLRVLAVFGLAADLELLAADDTLGRRLQDLALTSKEA